MGGGTRLRKQASNSSYELLPPYVCGNDENVQSLLNEHLRAAHPCGLVICDALEVDNPIIYVNQYFEQVTGYLPHEILGRNFRFLQCRGPYTSERHESVDDDQFHILQNSFETATRTVVDMISFTKNAVPLKTRISMYPLFGDNTQPSQATHFAGILEFRKEREMAPLAAPTPQPASNSQSVVTAVRGGEIPTPAEWNIPMKAADGQVQGEDQTTKPWLNDLANSLLTHLLNFLDMQTLLLVSETCKNLYTAAKSESVWLNLCKRIYGDMQASALHLHGEELGWERVVRELTTLSAVSWRSYKVDGSVFPARINFSTCSVGKTVILFGGEGAHALALNDTFLLDLNTERPTWQQVNFPSDASLPAGRWGHTLRTLSDGRIVLFGGCGNGGALNDLHILNLMVSPSTWTELKPVGPFGELPLARSWHGACTLKNSQLVIFGGCDLFGRILADTWVLEVDHDPPIWTKVTVGWRPPGRLGLSLCPTHDRDVVIFGGLASVGPVRMRTNDLFKVQLPEIELGETGASSGDSSGSISRASKPCSTAGSSSGVPSWEYVCGTTLKSTFKHHVPDSVPAPRMEQVMAAIPGERVIMFGGSLNDSMDSLALQPWVCNVNDKEPKWRAFQVSGKGPKHNQGYTLGYSSTFMDDLRFQIMGSYRQGSLIFDELYELNILSPLQNDCRSKWPSTQPSYPQLYSSTAGRRATALGVSQCKEPPMPGRQRSDSSSSERWLSEDDSTNGVALHSPGGSLASTGCSLPDPAKGTASGSKLATGCKNLVKRALEKFSGVKHSQGHGEDSKGLAMPPHVRENPRWCASPPAGNEGTSPNCQESIKVNVKRERTRSETSEESAEESEKAQPGTQREEQEYSRAVWNESVGSMSSGVSLPTRSDMSISEDRDTGRSTGSSGSSTEGDERENFIRSSEEEGEPMSGAGSNNSSSKGDSGSDGSEDDGS